MNEFIFRDNVEWTLDMIEPWYLNFRNIRTEREAVWIGDLGGPRTKEPCIRWGSDPQRKRQFWGLSGPVKSIQCLHRIN